MVLSAWFGLVVLGCHGFGLLWYCPFGPLGWFWVVMVMSAWSVLGCHGVVCLGGFGLSPVLGRHGVVCLFWVVMVLSVWSDVRCHGIVRLGGFGLSRCCLFDRFWIIMALFVWSALVVLGCYGVV